MKIGNNSNDNIQVNGSIIEKKNYFSLVNFSTGSSKDSTLKKILELLTPKKLLKKEISSTFIQTDLKTNYKDLFKNLLEREKDEEIYNTFLRVKDQEHPIEVVLYFYLAVINLSINGFKVPRNTLEKAIRDFKKFPDSYGNFYNIGNAFLGLELYSEAILYFKKSLKMIEGDTLRAEILKNLGGCYQGIGENKKAYYYYLKAFQINPNLFEVLISLGRYEVRENKDYFKALEYFDRIIFEKLPFKRKYDFYSWKAYLHYGNNSIEKSITYIMCGLQLDKTSEYMWKFGKLVFNEVNNPLDINFPLKLKFFENYTNKYPQESEVWALLGFDYYNLFSNNQPEYAEHSQKAFLKAIELGYKSNIKGIIYDRLGHLEEYLGNIGKAEIYYKEAVLVNEKTFSYCLGFFYQKQKQNSKAIKFLEKSAFEYDKDDLSWYNLGVCYLNTRKVEEAKNCFLKALEINPNYDLPLFALGEINFVRKKYNDSADYLKKLIKYFPNSQYFTQANSLLSLVEASL